MKTRYIIQYKIGEFTGHPLYHIYKRVGFFKKFLACKLTFREAEDYVQALANLENLDTHTFRYDKYGKYLRS